MSDEERKPSSTVIKYLLIAIAFLATMVCSAVVSIFVYKTIMEKKSEATVDQEIVTKENIAFDEFTIYPLAEKGMVKFKINAEVNDVKVKDYLDKKKPAVRDIITRGVMMFKIEEIKKIYQNEDLHKSIQKELNLIIGDNIKVESSFLGGQKKKKFLVVKVNVYDFSAMTME
ncbi:MAG TPA: hypothetical protein PKW98_00625 [Candidatus Wallbacteria bacterium]|nr:MAG: flagellar basal body-associated protein FliL [bacterium ADurb.Bin243]HOD42599.1 hypothetical protein [Candidatus Wallbacteria bacterium]HPG56292.1 hypothetical protein [Candidatus Wallbacteria bacterium]